MLSERTITKRVEEGLARDERWRVVIRGNCWLCPYCLRIGARDLRMDEAIEEKIAHHFISGCDGWNYFEAEPHPIERMRQTARFLVFKGRVLRWITDDPRFRLADDARRWVCPYCAQPTQIAAPDHALDDPAAWGPAPEEDPFLGDLVAHLLRCPSFAEGEDRARPLDELKAALARGATARRFEAVRERFEQEPSFRLMDQERRWLCPFCAKAQQVRLPEGGPDDAYFRGLAAHLEGCKAAVVLAGRPRPVEELKARISADARARQLSKVRAKVEKHSLWRVRDLSGAWLCPYCGQPTPVVFPERGEAGDRDPAEMDRFYGEVHQHLAGCEEYRRPDPQVKSREALAAAVEARNVQHDRRRRVHRLLTTDPLWGVTDPFSSWVCPFCARVQKRVHIDHAGSSGLFEKTVEAVAAHLWTECPTFDEGRPPPSTRQDLEAIARRQALKSSGIREPGVRVSQGAESMDEQSWMRIKQDLEAVKTRVERAKQRDLSLREARSKQLRLLPEVPELPGFEFARTYKPCDAVGGDFYAFFRASEAEHALAIGDISGHGIEAALLMGLAKKLLEVHGRGRASPAQTLALANRDIFSDLDDRTFVTVFYALLDTRARALRFSRAGHEPLVLYNPRRTPALSVLDSRGMALGMDEGPGFEQAIEEVEVPLRPGDLIVQYTDGITEAMNARNEPFGTDRLYQVIEEHGRHEAEYVLWKIEKAVEAFRGGEARRDDMTMIALKVLE
ncbi:MAG: PP2C family protein-serine/threonine phosphatase [Planctomycetota bacterium]|nr:PP2C family protein-serine/threonine phosphatase [Planctomycetota bacterium]